ncbi:type III secretory pathway component EscV [Bradyrhizobium sp. LM2.7]
MTSVLRKIIARASASSDLMVALMLLLTVGMMIMPIPIVAIDTLVGFNLGFAILLLMVGLYISTPLDFSSLPGVILISHGIPSGAHRLNDAADPG